MAKKSKTQKAKASAARQARKQERAHEEEIKETSVAAPEPEKAEKKPGLLKTKEEKPVKAAESDAKKPKKVEEKPKKKRFQFFRDVRSELKRVTWPTRQDVLRWSGVVVAALVFFGVFVAILDNFIITPLLVLISGADPSTIDWLNFLTGGEGANVDASNVDASGVDTSADTSVDASTADVPVDDGAVEAPVDDAAGDAGTADAEPSSQE